MILQDSCKTVMPFSSFLIFGVREITEAKQKRRSKSIHVKITTEMLIEAFVECLYFNKNVKKVRIVISRHGDEVPNQNVYITCTGRGRIKGKIVENKFHGTIYGTEREIKAWLKFFKDFVEAPEFSLEDYVRWLRNSKNSLGVKNWQRKRYPTK